MGSQESEQPNRNAKPCIKLGPCFLTSRKGLKTEGQRFLLLFLRKMIPTFMIKLLIFFIFHVEILACSSEYLMHKNHNVGMHIIDFSSKNNVTFIWGWLRKPLNYFCLNWVSTLLWKSCHVSITQFLILSRNMLVQFAILVPDLYYYTILV